MGLTDETTPEKNANGSIVDMIADIFKDDAWKLDNRIEGEPIDIKEYFAENTLVDPKMSDDDLLTISKLNEDGEYKAVFVRLGDLKKFFRS